MKKNLSLLLASSLLILLLLEGFLAFFLPRFQSLLHYDPQHTPEDLPAIEEALGSEGFHPQRGWDKPQPIRNPSTTLPVFAQAYGDSFVFCSEVPEMESWQAHFETLTGQRILNLGVGGYGIDQAVLKFEEYGPTLETEIAILGLFREMHRRNRSYHYAYLGNSDERRYAFKPFFVPEGNEFTLNLPPCETPDCLSEVLLRQNPSVNELLGRHDYFYQRNHGLPKNTFPRLPSLLRIVPEIARFHRGPEEEDYFPDELARPLSLHLVERFVKHSRQLGMRPVVLLIYSPRDLQVLARGLRPDQDFVQELEDRGLPFIDTGAYLLENYPDEDWFRFKAPGLHFNGMGNQRIAEALVAGLETLR